MVSTHNMYPGLHEIEYVDGNEEKWCVWQGWGSEERVEESEREETKREESRRRKGEGGKKRKEKRVWSQVA